MGFSNRLRLCGAALFLGLLPVCAAAQDLKTIALPEPVRKGGLTVMEALSLRASVREWSDRELTPQEISELLWSANGINRPEIKKRTAASALNAQDVDLYVFLKEGVYRYEPVRHALEPVAAGDHRKEIPPAGPRPAADGKVPPLPPVHLLLISDLSRFSAGTPEQRREWAALDAGIVSQNIALFCAARGLGTRPRASIDKERMKSLLRLKETQVAFLEHPVGYPPPPR